MTRVSRRRTHRSARSFLLRSAAVTLLALPCIALATPPSWAPAHGWRKKHDPHYAGYSGRQWPQDYGVLQGRCDRDEIGAVLGGLAGAALGGALGGEVAGTASRGVAIAVGTVIGAAIGSQVGRHMDRSDRACVGHALELAGPEQTISWSNARTGFSYQVTPLGHRSDGRDDGCRKFRLVAHGGFGLSEGRTTACASPDGTWRLAPEVQLSRR